MCERERERDAVDWVSDLLWHRDSAVGEAQPDSCGPAWALCFSRTGECETGSPVSTHDLLEWSEEEAAFWRASKGLADAPDVGLRRAAASSGRAWVLIFRAFLGL